MTAVRPPKWFLLALLPLTLLLQEHAARGQQPTQRGQQPPAAGPGRGGRGVLDGGAAGAPFGRGGAQGRGGTIGRGNANTLETPYEFEIPPAPALTPEEELATFQIVQGYRLELVAAEPMVVNPVALTFDPDGRIWVVEMRGFMPNVDGDGEDAPVGAISILEDTDHDGRMDKSHLYLDGLVMPRGLCWTVDGLLVCEQGIIWLCKDKDGDLVCDEKVEIARYLPGNLEHALNGLMPGLDNWVHNAKEGLNLRRAEGRWITETTVNRGQWGMTQDNYGRLYYNNNADLIRGDLVPSYSPAAGTANPLVNVQLYREQEVWPIRVNPGINRGYDAGYLRPDGTMINANSNCGPVVYRGDNLPADLLGDIFISETVGNLVRRQVMVEDEAGVYSVNAYAQEQKEFIASTDERFRPVNMFNAPDGTLYLLDMYRGVVQHGDFITPYLRNQIIERELEQPINLGRIWRIVHETTQPREQVSLSDASGDELVETLSHPNGWHRDMAQLLLVQRGDVSVVPALERLASSGDSPLGRLHALWTLEGLNQLHLELLLELTADDDPHVRASAVHLCSRMLGPDPNPALIQELLPLAQDEDMVVRLHFALTIGLVNLPIADRALEPILREMAETPEMLQALLAGFSGREVEFLAARVKQASWAEPDPWRVDLLASLAGLLWQQREPLAVLRLMHLLDEIPADRAWQQVTLLEGLAAAPGGGGRGGFAGRGGRAARGGPGAPGGGRAAGGGRGRGGVGRGRGGAPARLVTLPVAPEGLESLLASGNQQISTAARAVADQIIWPGKDGQPLPTKDPLSAEHQALYDSGRVEYLALCAGCHHPAGYGDAGKGPSLLDSEWLENDRRLIHLVLYGLQGPVTINGEAFNSGGQLSMPGMYQALDDQKIAAVLTYVRRELSLDSPPIEPAAVAAIRAAGGERSVQYTEAELRAIE